MVDFVRVSKVSGLIEVPFGAKVSVFFRQILSFDAAGFSLNLDSAWGCYDQAA